MIVLFAWVALVLGLTAWFASGGPEDPDADV